MTKAQSPFCHAETLFLELGEKPSTAAAATRDLERLFMGEFVPVSTDADRKKNEEAVLEELSGAQGGGSPEGLGKSAVAALSSALVLKSTDPHRGNVYRELVRMHPDTDINVLRRIASATVSALKGKSSSKEIDALVEKSVNSPTRAMQRVIETKVGKFFTRGMDRGQILEASKRELTADLKKVLKK